jgi:hypothetical protein
MKRILRVFPRRTSATPTDPLAVVGDPGLFVPEVDEVHVSAVFSWDLSEAERLARAWKHVAPVQVGGPATGMRGEAFTPGMYLAPGYTITSRGCPNRCWFCSVPRREGPVVRELPIADGHIVLDDNLLACSERHVRAVFDMLARQAKRAELTGGLEAARLEDWHADALVRLRPERLFFAYDTPDDWTPLQQAVRKLTDRGMSTAGHRIRAYVLCGHPRDTLESAEGRLRAVSGLGVFPMAMLWRAEDGRRDPAWIRFARQWANPTITGVKVGDRQTGDHPSLPMPTERVEKIA